MKVGLILHPYGEKMAAGLGRSIFSLAKSIVEGGPETQFTIFLKDTKMVEPFSETKNWIPVTLPGHLFWLDFGLFRKNDLDVYVFFTPVMPLFVKLKKTVLVVHDLGYLNLPANGIRQYLSRMAVKLVHRHSLMRVDKIIAVSDYTKSEIEKFYPEVVDKVVVILNGFNKINANNLEAVKQLPDHDFFLFVGVLKDRKNPMGVVKAFDLFKERTHSHNILVFAGKNDNSEVSKLINESKYKNDIFCLGYVSEKQLAYLYKKALALVFPSLLEGFGMPILESMDVGTPVITSDRGAMKEVAGVAAYLVNPDSVEDICLAMEKISSDENLRSNLTELGLERSKNFSWEKAAKGYLKIIYEKNN
ncbi:MAG: glycosyltransferase family 4 protein [Candidatus Vogelbacteria bacterium]|nr:glycosyltransferase family 4 protein [Candidatus Vogelbacteria bacterium]